MSLINLLACFLQLILLIVKPFYRRIIENGDFELGVNPGNDFIDITAPDSSTITGWTVYTGSVDYIGGRWASASGSRHVDLNGYSAGAISQDVSGFIPGQAYSLLFYMAASPDVGLGVSRTMQVNLGGVSQTFSAVGTSSVTNPGWTQRQLDFTASGSSMELSFVSLESGDWGPLVDGVSIVAVPEPGTLSLGIMALGFLAFASKKAGPGR